MTSSLINSSALRAAEAGLSAPAPGLRGTPQRLKTSRPYLAPVPDSAPPFDDERTPRSRLRALTEHHRQRQSKFPEPASAPASITDTAAPPWSREADVGIRKTQSASLAPAARTGSVLARALVEVLSGQRAMAQLRVHCAPDVFAGLENTPVVPGHAAQLMNVRICEPADGVAEVSAVFRRGPRVRALAFRLQGLDGRWRITALQTA